MTIFLDQLKQKNYIQHHDLRAEIVNGKEILKDYGIDHSPQTGEANLRTAKKLARYFMLSTLNKTTVNETTVANMKAVRDHLANTSDRTKIKEINEIFNENILPKLEKAKASNSLFNISTKVDTGLIKTLLDIDRKAFEKKLENRPSVHLELVKKLLNMSSDPSLFTASVLSLIRKSPQFYNFHHTSTTSTLPSQEDLCLKAQQALPKSLLNNAKKAIEEHIHRASKEEKKAFATLEEITSSAKTGPNVKLSFKHQIFEAQGPRPYMEDAHFYLDFDQGILAGVFDGHGGSEVSKYSSDQFKNRFPLMLKKLKGDIHQAFETLIQDITNEVFKTSEWNKQGTTAVITFVDKKTNIAYTATLGDSETNIYRKINGETKSISASCVRDWSSDKDWERHQKVNPPIKKPTNPKQIRSTMYNSFLTYGLNVSRAIGDKFQTGTKEKPLVINKPKITAFQLKEDDVLVLACDGLKDNVPENEIVDLINKEEKSEKLAESLVTKALENMLEGDGDNVTVMVIKA